MEKIIDDTETMNVPLVSTLITQIYNSKGNFWEPLGDNIQSAIDDLGNMEGFVYLPAVPLDVNTTVDIKDGVTLVMYGSRVSPSVDVNVFQLRKNSRLIGGTIDVYKHLGYGFSKAAVYIDGVDEINSFQSVMVKNIRLQGSDQGWTGVNNGSGVFIDCIATGNQKNCYSAHIQNVWIGNFRYGIRLSASGAGFANGNIINSATLHNCKYHIYLSKVGGSGTDVNIFSNYMIQPFKAITDECIHVEGIGNLFYGVIFDATQCNYPIHILPNANATRIIDIIGGAGIWDEDPYNNTSVMGLNSLKMPTLRTSKRLIITAGGGQGDPENGMMYCDGANLYVYLNNQWKTISVT